MKCSEVYLHVCDNLDQQLDSPRCRQIKRHLASCPDCRAYLDSMKTTVSLYRSVPAPRLPRSVHARLLRLMKTLETPHTRSPRGRRPARRSR